MSKTNFFCVVLLSLVMAIIAVGCSSNKNHIVNISNISNGTITKDEPSEAPPTEKPTSAVEPIATEEPTATIEPTAAAATSKPKTSKEPVKGSDYEAAATAKKAKETTPKPKPSAKVKRAKAPVIVLPPTPSPKPSTNPAATPQPSVLPIATTSPSPKPTSEPDPEIPSSEVTSAAIAAKLAADSGLGPLLAVDSKKIKEIYGIDKETQLIDGSFYLPKMTIQAGEFSIVQLKSDQSFSDIEAAFKLRAETVQAAFESYLQDQYDQAQNYQIIQNGQFVLFSITPDQKKTADIFNSFFVKKE